MKLLILFLATTFSCMAFTFTAQTQDLGTFDLPMEEEMPELEEVHEDSFGNDKYNENVDLEPREVPQKSSLGNDIQRAEELEKMNSDYYGN